MAVNEIDFINRLGEDRRNENRPAKVGIRTNSTKLGLSEDMDKKRNEETITPSRDVS